MTISNINHNRPITLILLLSVCFGCVPLQQQISEREDAEIEGTVDPVIIDEAQFNQTASLLVHDQKTMNDPPLPYKNNFTYEGTFEGKRAFIDRDRIENARVIKNKLVLTRGYAGPNSRPQQTTLFWNGRFYQDANGQYTVDVVLFTDPSMHRALIFEKKIFDVTALQREGAHSVSINLIGYDGLISYAY